VLLLISAMDCPPASILEFSQRQGLDIRRLRAQDDVETLLAEVRPAALAWDLAGASAADWVIVLRLHSHPQLCQLPFILYGPEQPDKAASLGVTGFVVKSSSGRALLDALKALCPTKAAAPILIVDDDDRTCELYASMVKKGLPNFSIRTANNGAEAMAIMTHETPSLVVLDLMMPEMDGFEVLDRMRADSRTRSVPVLILTNKLLTQEDIRRLEQHARVTLHTKGILSESEMIASLHRSLFGATSLPQHTSALVKRAVAYLHQNYARALARWEIAEAVGVSENYLTRVFNQELGLSPWEYLNRYRIYQAQALLRRTSDSIRSVARQVGFKDQAYFSRVFRKLTGISPKAFRAHPES